MGIYLSQLQKFPVYKKPPTYEISKHAGMGCFLDVPGYPSYRLHSVYTQYGNSPRKGTDTVLQYGGLYYSMPLNFGWNEVERDQILNRLWIPDPIESKPVQDWIAQVKAYFKNCYSDPNATNPRANTVVWPVSKFSYPVRPQQTIKDWRGLTYTMSDSDYRIVLSGYRAQVKAMLQAAWNIASNPDNSKAILHIRKFYPEYQPK